MGVNIMKNLFPNTVLIIIFLTGISFAQEAPKREVFWGDTHLHTSYSPDAYLLQNRSADPDTAYRYAKGQPVVHPYNKAKIQIKCSKKKFVLSGVFS